MQQPDFLKTDQVAQWAWGIGNQVWATIHAAMTGDVPRIESLLASDPSLIRCQIGYRQPLQFAVRENQVAAVRCLLDHGADSAHGSFFRWHDDMMEMCRLRGFETIGETLREDRLERFGICESGDEFADACRGRDFDRCKSLVREYGPAIADRFGSRAIHWASMTRSLDLVDFVLQQGGDVNSMRPDGARPLDLTNGDYRYRGWRDFPDDGMKMHWPIVGFLIARGAHYDLTTACRIGDIDRVRRLLRDDPEAAKRDADYITWYSGYCLRSAVKAGHLEIATLLLEYGADPNRTEHGIAPRGGSLYDCVQNHHLDCARLLVDHGADPNQNVESSGTVLSIARDDETRAWLRSVGARNDVFGSLLNDDADDLRANLSESPHLANDPDLFAFAAERTLQPLIDNFLEYQPDLFQRMPAIVPGDDQSMQALIDQGMNPNGLDWHGVHVVHRGLDEGKIDRWLSMGGQINLIDQENQATPLGWSARQGNAALVEGLLDRGADPRVAGQPWALPENLARFAGYPALAERISQAVT